MLLSLPELISKYNLNITGIIHIGGHTGEEHISYIDCRVPRVVYFEPVPWCYSNLCNHINKLNKVYTSAPDTTFERYALGNKNTTIDMHISKHLTCPPAYAASSSILKPKKHLEIHPDVVFDDIIEVEMKRLDDYNGKLSSFNTINIDVQGYELEVFRGAKQTLDRIDYIITEVNIDDVYEGCARMDELDEFLSTYGFWRMETCMGGGLWGDAFYMKNN